MDISIVTPVFNSVRWIQLCLQSVRHALQGRNYEHIVVDGGSTDGTLDYLSQQKDIHLILGPDKGMYDALNKGMATARGRILGHLNADEQYDRAGLADHCPPPNRRRLPDACPNLLPSLSPPCMGTGTFSLRIPYGRRSCLDSPPVSQGMETCVSSAPHRPLCLAPRSAGPTPHRRKTRKPQSRRKPKILFR